LYTLSGFAGRDVHITAWSGMAHVTDMGLDAIRAG
jgi:hypothetical protein